jgi:hypothetical protein
LARTIWVRGPDGWEEQPDPYDMKDERIAREWDELEYGPVEGRLPIAVPGEGRLHQAQAQGILTSNMPFYDACEVAMTLVASAPVWVMEDAGLKLVRLARKMHRENLSRRCRHCKAQLSRRRGGGRQSEFCGDACRAAAYRRREQRLRETLPRVKTGGRLTLRDRPRPTSRLVSMRNVRQHLLMKA